jgi:hypothetical protein
MKEILFQEKEYSYKGKDFVIRIFRTSSGLRVRSYLDGKDFTGALDMSAGIESKIKSAGMFDILFKNSDHLESIISMLEEIVRNTYDNQLYMKRNKISGTTRRNPN